MCAGGPETFCGAKSVVSYVDIRAQIRVDFGCEWAHTALQACFSMLTQDSTVEALAFPSLSPLQLTFYSRTVVKELLYYSAQMWLG
jgi:hypothetical protein